MIAINKPTDQPPLPPGRIDIHSHLLPGIDDGCEDIEESFACVHRLRQAGYVGSICTPHLWPSRYPQNTPANVAVWTERLAAEFAQRGIDYRIWAGGELRLFDGVVEWMKDHGVPTLGDSTCVLTDWWTEKWPKWIAPTYHWLREQGYQPILAHPERMSFIKDLEKRLADLTAGGVWLQGNFRCMTGEDGYLPDQLIRQWLTEKRYRFLALDMHRHNDIEGRLDGMQLVETEFGAETVRQLTDEAPRRDLLG